MNIHWPQRSDQRPSDAPPRMRRSRVVLVVCLGSVLGTACGTASTFGTSTESSPENVGTVSESISLLPSDTDPRKSILITDQSVLQSFSLFEVLQTLIKSAGTSTQTPLQAFQQMFDTENVADGGPGIHCTPTAQDTAALFPNDTAGRTAGSLNGWPIQCPRGEGEEATRNPFAPFDAGSNNPVLPDGGLDFVDISDWNYEPITLSNRFDLAPADGSNCGEYRINFARLSATQPSGFGSEERNFIAFEARLPNPSPSLGLKGCQPIVSFWQSLSSLSPSARAAQLHAFYITGIGGIGGPVIDWRNFGSRGGLEAGQVRTNSFLFFPPNPTADWSPREFLIQETCNAGPCTIQFVPSFDKDVPAATLFSPTSTNPLAAAFQADIPDGGDGGVQPFSAAVEKLALQDINTMNYPAHVTPEFNLPDDQIITNVTNYNLNFTDGGQLDGGAFKAIIQKQLTRIGSPLAPEDIVARAESLSCAGCHLISLGQDLGGGIELPSTGFPGAQALNQQGFVQVSEDLESVPVDAGGAADGGDLRFVAQPALTQIFLPYRLQIMTDMLSPVPGFERVGSWTSPQSTVSTASTPKTEGSSSLEVVPVQGWSEITSTKFSTVGLSPIGSSLSLDVFLPTHQTNPTWYGQVTFFVAIPSARIAKTQIGQVNLTGLPLGTFDTVSVPLPAAIAHALSLGVSDIQMFIQLNVNVNTSPYFLDNLRFH